MWTAQHTHIHPCCCCFHLLHMRCTWTQREAYIARLEKCLVQQNSELVRLANSAAAAAAAAGTAASSSWVVAAGGNGVTWSRCEKLVCECDMAAITLAASAVAASPTIESIEGSRRGAAAGSKSCSRCELLIPVLKTVEQTQRQWQQASIWQEVWGALGRYLYQTQSVAALLSITGCQQHCCVACVLGTLQLLSAVKSDCASSMTKHEELSSYLLR